MCCEVCVILCVETCCIHGWGKHTACSSVTHSMTGMHPKCSTSSRGLTSAVLMPVHGHSIRLQVISRRGMSLSRVAPHKPGRGRKLETSIAVVAPSSHIAFAAHNATQQLSSVHSLSSSFKCHVHGCRKMQCWWTLATARPLLLCP